VGGHAGAVEHMGKDLLRVLKPLRHVCILILEGSGEGVLAFLSLQVYKSH
jgi:hypothetical protein